ncbi:MAG: AMP-binding protein [Proteobacteria bacterium]|nr:AMP-binding protein [Pseudomonadota bacterium]
MGSILFDDEVEADLGRLDRAWRADDSFCFVPRKCPVALSWIEAALERLPGPLQRGHFALLTSGSTGAPKLVVGARSRAEGLARLLHALQQSEPVAQTLLLLPLTYCYALVNQWLWARLFDRTLTTTSGLGDPAALRRSLSEAQDAMLCLVGAQAQLLGRHFGEAVFPGVIRLHFAGGPFPQRELPLLRRMFPRAQVFNNYGCAEAMPRLALRRAEEGASAADLGRPLPGIELARDDAGRLLFRSPFAAVAVVDDQGFRALAPEQFVQTGDLGRPGAAGHWQLDGRDGEVFKRYGEKVAVSAVLSRVLEQWHGEAGHCSLEDALGEPGYVLVLAPAPSEAEVRGVLRTLRAHFPRPHWPLRLESVSALPRLDNGKVDRVGLGAMAERTVHWRQG